MAICLWHYLELRSLFQEMTIWFEFALNRMDRSKVEADLGIGMGIVLAGLARAYLELGFPTKSQEINERNRQMLSGHEDQYLLETALTLRNSGWLSDTQTETIRLLQESLRFFRKAHDP